jgi:chromosome segregation ATPase
MSQTPPDGFAAEAISELRQAIAPIEGVFTELGETLGRAVKSLSDITSDFGSLAQKLDDDRLAGSVNELQAAARRIGELAHTQAGADELEHITTLAGGIAGNIGRLRKTIGEVKVLAVNAKVEAAHIRARDMDFSVFTREIGRLAAVAEEGLDGLQRELESLNALVRSALSEQQEFQRTHRESLGTVGGRINAGLATLVEHRHRSAGAVAELAEESARVGRRVGEAVMALQIGDITRQRIEHVCEAFSLVDKAVGADSDLSGDDRALLVAEVSRLQAAQLARTADELEGEAARLATSLTGLLGETDSVRTQGASAYGGGGGSGSFLQELSEEVEKAGTLMERYGQARAEIERVVAAVGTAVEAMLRNVEAVRSIEVDMRLMGLNATLKCGRLGSEGRALSVIAQELRAYANRTVEDSRGLMQRLDAIAAAADGLEKQWEEQAAGSSLDDITGAMRAAVAVFDAAGEDQAAALNRLVQGSGAAGSMLQQASRRIADHATLAARLRRVAQRLDHAAGQADPADPRIADMRAHVLALLEGRYTMASERVIHALFAGDGPASDGATSAPASADDFLF